MAFLTNGGGLGGRDPSALAAAVAIGSKFLVRVRGKHVFNPANVALVTLMLLSDRAWISTGQWGSTTLAAFGLACLGFLVLTRAKRAEAHASRGLSGRVKRRLGALVRRPPTERS